MFGVFILLFCVEVEYSEDKEKFLSLPKKLYDKEFLTQDWKTEMQILNHCHPLSEDFTIYPYIVVREDDNIVARAILTVYVGDKSGYVGFFESVQSQEIVNCLLDKISEKAKELGLERLIGPLDCSFWIKYRFKIDHFDNCYTNEPYNKEYYKELWENWGFTVCDKYYSNQMRVPTAGDSLDKPKKRLEMMKSKGYEFRMTDKKTFSQDLKDIFNLMKEVYSHFSGFKMITEEQFVELYSGLKMVLNYNMVHLAYKDGELVGFFVAIPNYRNGLYDLNMLDFIRILNIKNNPKEYIMLYMGASPEHLGLGGSFAEIAKTYLQEHNCTSVGALIHEGNTSGVFYKNLVVDRYEYVLMDKDLGGV